MVDLITVGVVIGGLAFLFFGATASSYAVNALGLVVGGGAGYLLGPTIADTAEVGTSIGLGIGAVGGAIVGVVLSLVLLSVAVAAIGFVLGTYSGFTVAAGRLVDGGTAVEAIVAIAIGLVFAVVAMTFTKTMMVILTAFVGAALASMSVTFEDLEAAAMDLDPDPILFEPEAPIFVALFVLGILTQFGLFKFGYVTKILGILPGVKPLRNRGEE